MELVSAVGLAGGGGGGGGLGAPQVVILGVYFALLVSVAWAFRKLNRDGSDYFRSGCRGRWWLVGMSVYMSSFSALSFTGFAGVAYEAGWSAITPFVANVLGFAVNAVFLAAWLRQLRVTTHPEVVRDRFGVLTEQVFSWHGTVFGLFYAGMTLYTVCIFLTTVFQFNLQGTIVLTGLAVLFYTLVGGRWAVMGNDFLQGLFLVPICVLTALLCVWHAGGIEGVLEGIRARGLVEDYLFVKPPREEFRYQFTAPWILASMTALMIDRLGLTAAPRYFSCRDGREARRAAWLVTGLMVLSTAIFFLPPVTARLLMAEEVEAMAALGVTKPAETSFAVAAMRVLPEGLMGLMVVAILAATVSTMDTGLNLFAAIFTKNIFPLLARRMGWREPGPRGQMRMGQAVTLVSGAAVIGLALYFSGVKGQGAFEQTLTIGALFGAPMGAPMILGLFTRRAPGHSALWSMVAGLVVALAGFWGNWLYEWRIFGVLAAGVAGYFLAYRIPACLAHGALWLFGGGLAAWVVLAAGRALGWLPELSWQVQLGILCGGGLVFFPGAWLFPARPDPDEPRRVREFYERMHRPVDFEAEVGEEEGPDAQARILGVFSLVIAGLILLLAAPEQPAGLDGRLGVVLVAAVPTAVGLALLRVSIAGRRR